MTINPIAIGFDWRQAFDFPTDFFQPGDRIRAEFRQFATDREAIVEVEAGQGAAIEGSRLHLSLDEIQTRKMKSGSVVTNFVVERGDEEIAIGVIVTVPVVLLPTRPRA